MINVKCLMLLEEQSKFEMEIGPWISMRKLGPDIKDLGAAQENCVLRARVSGSGSSWVSHRIPIDFHLLC